MSFGGWLILVLLLLVAGAIYAATSAYLRRRESVQKSTAAVAKPDRSKLNALVWEIQNGSLPVISAPIVLQKNETCHFAAAASWYEPRVETTRVDYAHASYRIRVAKGLSFRVGSVKARPVKRDVLTRLDDGTVYFTNTRVIFDGAKANKTIKLSKLIGFEPYTDAISLERETGKNPVIMLGSNGEIAAVVLSEILARA